MFHKTVWEMEQVTGTGISAAMIFHIVAMCLCLFIVILLSEMCALAFP